MKTRFFLFLSVALLLAASPIAAKPGTLLYGKYRGAWFTIEYAAGWKIQSPSRSSASETGSDSARFTYPDGSAEFYVFSPQWNGHPQEAAVNKKREVLVSQHVESSLHGKQAGGSYLYNPVAHWYTVRARDNSYQRSWVDVEDKGLNVRHVFGLKYRTASVYQKYRAQYAHFCKSLEQFSD